MFIFDGTLFVFQISNLLIWKVGGDGGFIRISPKAAPAESKPNRIPKLWAPLAVFYFCDATRLKSSIDLPALISNDAYFIFIKHNVEDCQLCQIVLPCKVKSINVGIIVVNSSAEMNPKFLGTVSHFESFAGVGDFHNPFYVSTFAC